MSQFEVFRPNSKEPGRNDHVHLHNIADHAWFEPVTDSNKGFKLNFFFVCAKSKSKEDAREKLTYPMSWSRVHFDHNNGAFNVDYKGLVGDDNDSFDLLKEWGTRMKKRVKKLHWEEIINAEAESKVHLKFLLSRAEANRVTAMENKLFEAKRLEAEAQSILESLEAQVQLSESGRAKVEEELKEAGAFGFARCKGIVAVLAPEVNLELMQLEHQVIGSKVVRLKDGRLVEEVEILHQLESDEESE